MRRVSCGVGLVIARCLELSATVKAIECDDNHPISEQYPQTTADVLRWIRLSQAHSLVEVSARCLATTPEGMIR